MPRTPATEARDRAARGSVAYWVVAVLLYAGLGILYPPAALLGFWQTIPYLLVAHLARPHVLRAAGRVGGALRGEGRA